MALLEDQDLQWGTVLDIGCSSGVFPIHLARHFRAKTVLGVDIDPKVRLELRSDRRVVANVAAVACCRRAEAAGRCQDGV